MMPPPPLFGHPAAQRGLAPVLRHFAVSMGPAEFAKFGIALLPLRFIHAPIKPEALQQVTPSGTQALSRAALPLNPTSEACASGIAEWDVAMAVPALKVRECTETNNERKIPAEVKAQT